MSEYWILLWNLKFKNLTLRYRITKYTILKQIYNIQSLTDPQNIIDIFPPKQ